ncbi:MAG: hypothetical protein IKU03_03810 [Bacteroidales bacterium]|nr:hypothetical protein [Bacteroidales bacterium]
MIWIFVVLVLLATSCSRKIVGSPRHRRDRNCGCELPSPCAQDSLLTQMIDHE